MRRGAIHAIGSVGPAETAVPQIEEFLGDESQIVRRAAAETLGRMGPAAKDAIPALEKTLRLEILLGANPKAKGLARVLTYALRKIKNED
ncbi:MAG: HEAT repeat domain-containing protein [Planctomycetes bacterium]|nr:HEAT repeat domain-containing protein [Planctomycetota bacterium]